MEALAKRGAGQSGCARFWVGAAVSPLLCLFGFNAAGQPSTTIGGAGDRSAYERGRVELSTRTLPLFASPDGASRSTRLDMIWLPPLHPNLGLALGVTRAETPGFISAGSGTAPMLDLGFQWRYALDSHYRIDVTAWRRVAPMDAVALVQDHQPDYGARVEMQLGAAPTHGFVAKRGFLGLQLEGGARISVRRTAGHPMIYYRTNF